MARAPTWFLCLTFTVFAASIVLWVHFSNESFTGSPGLQRDDVYFENIAFNLSVDRGVAFDFTDEQWQKPYRDVNSGGKNDWIFDITVRGKTTSRAPGFPLFASAIYKAFGRNWQAVKVTQVALLAIALTWIAATVYKIAGALAAVIAIITLALDYFVLRTAGQFMSEALGITVVALVFCCCIELTSLGNERSKLYWLPAGLLFGFGTLVRSNLNSWFLLIAACSLVYIGWLCFRRRPIKPFAHCFAFFVIGTVAIAGPLWIRNCLVAGAAAPFGTSGSFGLSGGYCDQAFEDFGNWNIGTVLDSQQESFNARGFFSMSLAEQEYQMGRDSMQLALNWIAENPVKIPLLMLMKGYSHLGFYGQPTLLVLLNSLLYFGAIIGCLATRDNFGRWVFVFVGLSLLTTMLTWAHFGRYSIPVRPLVHAACAIGIVVFWRSVFEFAARFRQPGVNESGEPS